MSSCWTVALLRVAASSVLFGCHPQFRLNTEGRDPAAISRTQAEAIAETLRRCSARPTSRGPGGRRAESERLQAAAGPIGGDAEGNQWGLFRRHCAACHGTSGDGAGPSAAVLNPYPRDFRNGVFKYTSTAGGAKPLRDDLLRTFRQGIPGTAMPSFCKLPDREIEALLEYVKYLSIRGQTELYLLQTVVDEDAVLPLAMHEVMAEGVLPAARSWDEARRAGRRSAATAAGRHARAVGRLDRPGRASCSTARAANVSSVMARWAMATASRRNSTTTGTSERKGPRRSRPLPWPGGSACPSSRCVRGTSRWASSTAATGRSISIGGFRWASRARRCRRPAPPPAARAS